MKLKKLTLGVLFITLFGCNEDSTELQSDQNLKARGSSSEILEMKQKYIEVLSSNEYEIYQRSAENFASYLPSEYDSSIDNDVELKSWLNRNISTTRFRDIDEAYAKYEIVKNNFNAVLSNSHNREFYDRLYSEFDVNDRIEILYITIPDNPEPVTNSCIRDCNIAGSRCRIAVGQAYATAMATAIGITPLAGGIAAAATIGYVAGITGCDLGQDLCRAFC